MCTFDPSAKAQRWEILIQYAPLQNTLPGRPVTSRRSSVSPATKIDAPFWDNLANFMPGKIWPNQRGRSEEWNRHSSYQPSQPCTFSVSPQQYQLDPPIKFRKRGEKTGSAKPQGNPQENKANPCLHLTRCYHRVPSPPPGRIGMNQSPRLR